MRADALDKQQTAGARAPRTTAPRRAAHWASSRPQERELRGLLRPGAQRTGQAADRRSASSEDYCAQARSALGKQQTAGARAPRTTGSGGAAQARIERVAESVAEEVEREDSGENRHPGPN